MIRPAFVIDIAPGVRVCVEKRGVLVVRAESATMTYIAPANTFVIPPHAFTFPSMGGQA